MNRIKSLVSRKNSGNDIPTTSQVASDGDSPEADIARGVRLFCESGGPNNTGEEVLHLPVIVDAAESSPTAAKEAALVIRKFLGKSNFNRAYVQYNAIMLLRILADNPGASFTKNIDSKFVATVKELLRDGRDMGVQILLRESLDSFELQKADDETLKPLILMWKNEKTKWSKRSGNDISSAVMQNHRAGVAAPVFMSGQQIPAPPNHRQNSHQTHYHRNKLDQLPPPHELASRIEECKTTSKLLTQVVQATGQNEILSNDLIREFAERCREASRSISGYINAENPAPDENTLLTLIETNDGIAAALSKHQRALLNARKAISGSPPKFAHQNRSDGQSMPPNGASHPMNTQTIPNAGSTPIGSMSKPSEMLDNPFDDSNRSDSAADNQARTVRYGDGDTNASRSVPGGIRSEEDDDDSSAPPRQYRF